MGAITDFIMGKGALKKAEKGAERESPKQTGDYDSAAMLRRNEEAADRERKRKAAEKAKLAPKKTSQVIGDQMMRMG